MNSCASVVSYVSSRLKCFFKSAPSIQITNSRRERGPCATLSLPPLQLPVLDYPRLGFHGNPILSDQSLFGWTFQLDLRLNRTAFSVSINSSVGGRASRTSLSSVCPMSSRCPDGQPTPVSPSFPARRSLDRCVRARRTHSLRLERCERCPGRIDIERKRPKGRRSCLLCSESLTLRSQLPSVSRQRSCFCRAGISTTVCSQAD